MPQELPQQQKKKGILESLGFFSKVIIFIIIAVIATIIIFGLSLNNLPQFLFNLVIVAVAVFLIFLIIKGAMSFFAPKAFSPSGDFKTKTVNKAKKLKPAYVGSLYLRGEGVRSRALVGKITGLGWIPYQVSKEATDDKGKTIFLKNKQGELLLDRNDKPIAIREKISSKDGDVVFIVKNGLFDSEDIIRCHPKFCSELVGDIYVYDVGFNPYGDYYYPSKQWQSSIIEIMMQNQIESTIMTHFSQLDLVSDVAKLALAGNPVFQQLMQLRDERVMATPMPQGATGYR